MTTAIIGVGNIGTPLARHLTGGGEPVILAAKAKAKTSSNGWLPAADMIASERLLPSNRRPSYGRRRKDSPRKEMPRWLSSVSISPSSRTTST